MLWSVATAGALGVVLGFRLRVGAVCLVSAAILAACVVATALMQWSLLPAVGFAIAVLICLQISYLLGLAISCVLTGAPPTRDRASTPLPAPHSPRSAPTAIARLRHSGLR